MMQKIRDNAVLIFITTMLTVVGALLAVNIWFIYTTDNGGSSPEVATYSIMEPHRQEYLDYNIECMTRSLTNKMADIERRYVISDDWRQRAADESCEREFTTFLTGLMYVWERLEHRSR